MTLNVNVLTQVVVPKIEEAFPWVQYLTESEQADFWSDLVAAFRNAMQSGEWLVLKQTMDDWKATAEVKSVPELEAALTRNIRHGDWVSWDDARLPLQNRNRKKSAQRS